jgi:HipA-like C-terminal domain
MLRRVCGKSAAELIERLIEMLVFDALIGSMDRHMQNWGLVATIGEPRQYSFAPIFDSARALLWNYDEGKLKRLLGSQNALDGYINRSRPKIGTHRKGRAMNHFELVEHLVLGYPVPTREALEKVRPEKVQKVAEIVREFPFNGIFSRLRKHLIVQVLAKRADKLFAIAQEGR